MSNEHLPVISHHNRTIHNIHLPSASEASFTIFTSMNAMASLPFKPLPWSAHGYYFNVVEVRAALLFVHCMRFGFAAAPSML